MFDDVWLAAGNAGRGGRDARCALHSLSYAACPELLQGMGGRREACVQEQVFTSSQTSATLVLCGACAPLCNSETKTGIGVPAFTPVLEPLLLLNSSEESKRRAVVC